jgi:type II secretory pathway pseudopilin PulG
MKVMLKNRNEKGTSIVEMLIVVLIVGILTMAMARFFVTHSHLSNVEEQVGFMQKNLRSALEIIIRDVMNAGSGVPQGMGLDPLEPGDGPNGSADSLVINANFEYRYTTLYEDEGMDGTIHVMDATGFYVGGMVYIEDFDGGEFHTVGGISLDTPKEDQITLTQPLSRSYYKIDAMISPIARVSYQLSWNDAEHPKLMRTIKGVGTKVLADNIEDIQFHFVLVDGSETSQPADISQVRMVKIMVTSRTNKVDCSFGEDGYRRRTLESEVYPRNLNL